MLIQIMSNVSNTWDSHLNGASSDWSQSVVLDTAVVAGGGSSTTCSPTKGKVKVCNATYGGTGWLGVASIWAFGPHITQGTVKLNDTYFNSPPYNTQAWRNLVMCQEVGHTFGLDHQDENFNNANLGTCMDYTNNPSTNQHPNQHDYDQLVTIYSHLDSTTTVASSISQSPSRGNSKPAAHNTPTVADDIDTSNPAEWGMMARSMHGGRVEVYERNLGAKKKLITFVVWAE